MKSCRSRCSGEGWVESAVGSVWMLREDEATDGRVAARLRFQSWTLACGVPEVRCWKVTRWEIGTRTTFQLVMDEQ